MTTESKFNLLVERMKRLWSMEDNMLSAAMLRKGRAKPWSFYFSSASQSAAF
jgi:hypothetical protein